MCITQSPLHTHATHKPRPQKASNGPHTGNHTEDAQKAGGGADRPQEAGGTTGCPQKAGGADRPQEAGGHEQPQEDDNQGSVEVSHAWISRGDP